MSAGKRRREDLKPLIEEVFAESGRTYGYRRVHAALGRMGIEVDDELVRALMRDLGLTPVQVKRRRGLTSRTRRPARSRTGGPRLHR
ncbi:IS3 family transposase [Spongiactinospora rosea]|nr:IS3 family transposase [Spongiactinospora rosea]